MDNTPNHTWIFVLLLCAVMLTMGVFGFAIFSIYNVQDTELDQPSENLPESTTPDSATEPAETEVETPVSANRTTHAEQYPTFSTPSEWQVSVELDSDYYISNTIVRTPESLEDDPATLTLTHYKPEFIDAPTPEILIESFNDYLTGEPPQDLLVSSEPLQDGVLHSISGTTPEDQFLPHFEELLLFIGTDGTVVYIRFADFNGNADLIAEWQGIKSSLIF